MATSNSQGIQTLLEAEKEASKIVQKARQYRVQRLKDARTEAVKEIEELREQRMQEMEQLEQGEVGSSDAVIKKLDVETQQRLAEVKAAFDKNKAAVVERVLQTVMSVDAKVHPNVMAANK